MEWESPEGAVAVSIESILCGGTREGVVPSLLRIRPKPVTAYIRSSRSGNQEHTLYISCLEGVFFYKMTGKVLNISKLRFGIFRFSKTLGLTALTGERTALLRRDGTAAPTDHDGFRDATPLDCQDSETGLGKPTAFLRAVLPTLRDFSIAAA
jgi:hypothetical protein